MVDVVSFSLKMLKNFHLMTLKRCSKLNQRMTKMFSVCGRVTLGEWIEIKAKRYHQDGLLEIGPHHARVTGSAKGSLRTLNIPNVIWIGGLDLENSRSGH